MNQNSRKKINLPLFLLLVVGVSVLFWSSARSLDDPIDPLSDAPQVDSPTFQPTAVVHIEESAPADIKGTGSPVISDSLASSTAVGKHQVELRTQSNAKAYVLSQGLTESQLVTVKRLGGRVTPSSSGRTESVVRFDAKGEARSDAQIQKALADAGISLTGQLFEFRMIANPQHDHGLCGSCLAANHSTVSQVEGVLAVPVYLGDSFGEQVDVVADPRKVSSDEIITLLEVDHTQVVQPIVPIN